MTTPPRNAPPTGGLGAPVADAGAARHDSLNAERWTSRGMTKVLREAVVGEAELRGSVGVGGSLRASRLALDGLLEVGGPVEIAGAVSGRGELHGGATLRAGSLGFQGKLRLGGALGVDGAAQLHGWMHVASVTAAELHAQGVVQIPGALRAGTVDLRLRDGSRIGPIEGTNVRVAAPTTSWIGSLVGRSTHVEVFRIEAQRVELSGVEAAFVRAPEIVLGPGCRVTAVEGTIVRRHPTSSLGPESRTPPPYGLWR